MEFGKTISYSLRPVRVHFPVNSDNSENVISEFGTNIYSLFPLIDVTLCAKYSPSRRLLAFCSIAFQLSSYPSCMTSLNQGGWTQAATWCSNTGTCVQQRQRWCIAVIKTLSDGGSMHIYLYWLYIGYDTLLLHDLIRSSRPRSIFLSITFWQQ